MYDVSCMISFCWLLYDVSCMSHVSCLTSPVSRLLSHVSCLTSPVSHLLSHISCLTFHVPRLLSHVSCLTVTSPVSSLLSHISCLISHGFRLTSSVFCLMSPFTCLLYCVLSLFLYTIPQWLVSQLVEWREVMPEVMGGPGWCLFFPSALKIPKLSAINAWNSAKLPKFSAINS